MNLTDRVTSPEPRNWQSTWDIRQQPLRWCLHLQGCGRSDGRHFDSRRDSWTGWSPYLWPELQAAFLGSRWLAKRTQPPSPEGSRIWVWSRTWWSTTLFNQKQGQSNFVITHYYILWHIITYQRVPAWFHSRKRRRRIQCQRVLHVHLFWLTWWTEVSIDHTRHWVKAYLQMECVSIVLHYYVLDCIMKINFCSAFLGTYIA
jgi:hypothetical protein